MHTSTYTDTGIHNTYTLPDTSILFHTCSMWSRIGCLWSSSTWPRLVVQRQTSRMETCRLTNSDFIDWPLTVEDSGNARRRKQEWNKFRKNVKSSLDFVTSALFGHVFLSAYLLTGLGWLYYRGTRGGLRYELGVDPLNDDIMTLYHHHAGLPRPGVEGAPMCLCRNERPQLQWLLAQASCRRNRGIEKRHRHDITDRVPCVFYLFGTSPGDVSGQDGKEETHQGSTV